jgi:DNA-binding NarL/FixJ family response regulator
MQHELFDDLATRRKKQQEHDSQLILPVDPLQERLKDEEDPILTRCEYEIILETLKAFKITDLMLHVFISRFGIKYRLSNIYNKFKVKDRMELIKKASTEGLQFRTSSGIKHTFFMELRIKEYEKKESKNAEEYLKEMRDL